MWTYVDHEHTLSPFDSAQGDTQGLFFSYDRVEQIKQTSSVMLSGVEA